MCCRKFDGLRKGHVEPFSCCPCFQKAASQIIHFEKGHMAPQAWKSAPNDDPACVRALRPSLFSSHFSSDLSRSDNRSDTALEQKLCCIAMLCSAMITHCVCQTWPLLKSSHTHPKPTDKDKRSRRLPNAFFFFLETAQTWSMDMVAHGRKHLLVRKKESLFSATNSPAGSKNIESFETLVRASGI